LSLLALLTLGGHAGSKRVRLLVVSERLSKGTSALLVSLLLLRLSKHRGAAQRRSLAKSKGRHGE
jgi:hypothetical protein